MPRQDILATQAQIKAMSSHGMHADCGIANQRKAGRYKFISVNRYKRV